MKTIIIGAGASGVVAAINQKRIHSNDEILIIEHLDKPLKKILATGNGKCNLGNSNINFERVKNGKFAQPIIEQFNYEKFYESISIKTKLIGELAYPVSESAVSVKEALLNELKRLSIKINLEEKLIDYIVKDKIEVTTNKGKYTCDKLILAGGLKSSPKLGSDGSVLEILQKHGYEINQTNPGLCPIYTVEKTKEIDGVRVKAKVKLLENGKQIHSETGEVLFKDHGLSGIVIFNTASLIARNPSKKHKIIVDLLPDFYEEYLECYGKQHGVDSLLLAFINPKISVYLKNRFKRASLIVRSLKNLEFSFDKFYGFDFSQVTVGGVKVEQIDANMMSKKERNVYIIGELIDVDGPCGGYNLTWAFASANKIN